MTADNQTTKRTAETATKGDTILVKGRPSYRGVIESDSFDRLTIRPLADQGVTTRARAIWRKAILKVVANG